MRIKKKLIEAAVNTSNTTGSNTQNNSQKTANVPPVEDINKSTEALKKLEDGIKKLSDVTDKNTPIFMTKVSENTFDPNYGRSEDLELRAWQDEEIRNAFHEWLVSTPEGQAYAEKLSQPQINQPENNPTDDLPFENFKDKRTVIKTIKVKDLK